VSDIDTAEVDSLKALDPNRPIREANMSLLTQGIHALTFYRVTALVKKVVIL